MPIPKPKKAEKQDDFISRFMGDETMVVDYPENKQRYAIAMQIWRDKDKMKNNSFITTNMSSLVKEEVFEGEKVLRAPIVIARLDSVMNEIFYPASAWEATINEWNGRQFIVVHAYDSDGKPIPSADDMSNVEKQRIGELYNARIDGDKVIVDAIINIKRAESKPAGKRVLAGLRGNKNFDVSTGMTKRTDDSLVTVNGEVNGKKYAMVMNSFVPDHVAIVDRGAASWSDGVGFPRVNCAAINELAISDLEKQLYKLVDEMSEYKDSEESSYCHLVDVFPESKYIIYKKIYEGVKMIYKQNYDSVDVDGIELVELIGEPVAVRVEYMEIDNSEEIVMNEKLKVLVDAKTISKDLAESATSETMVNELLKLTEKPVVNEEVKKVKEEAETVKAEKEELETTVNAMKVELETLKAAEQKRIDDAKAEIIGTIVNSGKSTFNAEELKSFEIPQLNKLAEMAKIDSKSFYGVGQSKTTVNAADMADLPCVPQPTYKEVK